MSNLKTNTRTNPYIVLIILNCLKLYVARPQKIVDALNMLHHFLVKVITVWMHLRLMLVDGSGRLVFPGAVRKFPECFVNVKLHLFRVCHAVFPLCRGTCQRQR